MLQDIRALRSILLGNNNLVFKGSKLGFCVDYRLDSDSQSHGTECLGNWKIRLMEQVTGNRLLEKRKRVVSDVA